MSRYRTPSRSSKYFVDQPLFDLSVRFARMLPAWQKDLAGDLDEGRREDLERRVKMIETAAGKAAPDETLRDFLLQSVTTDASCTALQMRGMPCGKDLLIKMRHRFYFELSEMIK